LLLKRITPWGAKVELTVVRPERTDDEHTDALSSTVSLANGARRLSSARSSWRTGNALIDFS